LKRVFPQESAAGSHSLSSNECQQMALGGSRRVQTSAAMLGIAISFGASASLLTEPQAALAAEGTVITVLPSATDELAEPDVPRLVVSQEDAPSTAYHTVEDGDSLWQIAAEHHTDVQLIKSANGISPNEVLQVGQVIRVPAGSETASLAATSGEFQLALGSSVTGSVGGEFSADAVNTLPQPVPSVDELEQTWDSSDASSLTPQEDAEASDADAEEDVVAVAPQSGTSSSVVTADKPKASAATSADNTATVGSSGVEPSASVAAAESQEAVWQDDAVTANAADKVSEVAFVGDDAVEGSSVLNRPSTVDTRFYTVKPGDTFWSIASSHGISSDELLSYNETLDSPEDIAVGDQLSVPVDVPAVVASTDPSSLAATPEAANSGQDSQVAASTSTTLEGSPQSREAFIQEHLARIRASANRDLDREELNARIRAARQALEASQTGTVATQSSASLEYSEAPKREATVAEPESVALTEPESVALAETQAVTSTDPASAREGAVYRQVSAVANAAYPALAVNLRSQNQSQWSVTDGSTTEVTEVTEVTARSTEVAARSEESSAFEGLEATGGSTPVAPDPSLLAAAPMNPDVYQAAPSLPVGQTVSPDMPILPESDEYLPEVPNRFDGYMWPARGTLTSGYGWRWGRMHRGIDIAGPVGTPVMAAASGVVVSAGWNSGGYGNLVDIRHADGSMTRYAHNSRLLVRAGQEVRQGQQIAEMGSTGFSTGPHLHFEVHLPNAGTVNPIAYLPGR
jgi:murein DD-endopeptidase MepM/ murein hydrolase activator NlpD